jgi:hypothetical protein
MINPPPFVPPHEPPVLGPAPAPGIPAEPVYRKRIVPFVFSDDQRFLLVFQKDIDAWPVVWEQSVAVYDAATGAKAAELESPYAPDEWFDVQYKQINDVMYLAHPKHPPMRLERGLNAAGDAAQWRLFRVEFDMPPLLDENVTDISMKFTPDVEHDVSDTGLREGVLESNVEFFHSLMVGGYFKLSHMRESAGVRIALDVNVPVVGVADGRPDGIYYYRRTGSIIVFGPTVYWGSWVECSKDEYEYSLNHLYKDNSTFAGDMRWQVMVNIVGNGVDDYGILSNEIELQGNWSLVTTEHWYGDLYLQVSRDNGTTWETIRHYEGNSDRNINNTGNEKEWCLMRLRFKCAGDPFDSKIWGGARPGGYARPNAYLESEEAYIHGLVRVTQFVDPNTVRVVEVKHVSGVEPTKVWAQSAWSEARGYPACVGLFEQRMFWANTREKPNTIWASCIDDFENFEYGDKDSDAFVIALAATEQNGIMWLDSLRRFHAATKSRDFSITGGEQDGTPISATSLLIRSESVSGATNAQPVAMDDVLLFVGRSGVRLHELAYSLERDGYIGNDISMLAPHLLEAGVVQLAYARQPDNIIYCLMQDGSLAAMSYAPAEKVNAWARIKLAEGLGTVESICVTPGKYADEVWVCGRRGVMRMASGLGDEADVHLDAAAVVTGEGEGKGVEDWGFYAGGRDADGLGYNWPYPNFDCVVFCKNGSRLHFRNQNFSFDEGDGMYKYYFPREVKGAQRCVIGLPYTGELETMPVDAVFQDGPVAGMMRRIVSVTPNFYETVSCRIGRREAMPPVNFRTTADRMDSLNAPFSGYTMPLAWPAGSSRDETIRVVQDLPFPCTLLGMAVKWEVMG